MTDRRMTAVPVPGSYIGLLCRWLLLLALCSALLISNVSATSAPAATHFTFGYLRMASLSVDSPNTVAGLLVTAKRYNEARLIPGATFSINVTTIPCTTTIMCRNFAANPIFRSVYDEFVAKMPMFTAVFKPNAILAMRIVDEAKRIGGLPVINPDDIRMEGFSARSPNLIHLRQNWVSETEHLFTYMHQTGRCARSAIVRGVVAAGVEDDYEAQIATVQQLFVDGEYEKPPAFESQSATDEEFFDFFLSESPSRRCFIVIGTAGLLREILTKLNGNPLYSPRDFSFFGLSMLMSDTFHRNASMYNQTYFTHWMPQADLPHLGPLYNSWYSRLTAEDLAMSLDVSIATEVFDDAITSVSLEAYFMTRYVFETIRTALSYFSPNATDPSSSSSLPLSWADLLTAFYTDARAIEGHLFNRLVRECPLPPAEQRCFCNALAPSSYIYALDEVGHPTRVEDDVAKGQRNVAYVTFPSKCGYEASSWSYPITGLALFPQHLLASKRDEDTALIESYKLFQDAFEVMTQATNYEPTPPTRALRYAAYDVNDDPRRMQWYLDHYSETLKPFVVYGSLSNPILSSNVLTLNAALLGSVLEDPPLTSVDQWQHNILQLTPTIADYVHTLANYYSVNEGQFTAIHAIASTQREAELISMSFATWGYDVPVASVVVSTSPAEWRRVISGWMKQPSFSSSMSHRRPFVLAATQHNNFSLVENGATAVSADVDAKGTLAVACSLDVPYQLKRNETLFGNATATTGANRHRFSAASSSPDDDEGVDIIFGAFRREWWLPSVVDTVPASLQKYALVPQYHVAMLAMQFSRQLYSQVYYDYKKTAAQVLYSLSVVSASDTSFGPFYNETCSDAEIAANTRDRQCQCTKGIHTIFVHSLRDYHAQVESDRTRRHSWTMTQCGVIYRAYVPPEVALSSTLAAGAIAGIVVGCCALILGIACYVVYTLCFAGRDNSAAPKDSSQPFAIVFTDIQSSTALWARAPNAMSEAIDQHHRLIRKAVRSNKGYEVKTVGDSFMVAFKRTEDAVRFSLDVQLLLFKADWSSEIDATYIELEAESGEALVTHTGGLGVDQQSNTTSYATTSKATEGGDDEEDAEGGAAARKRRHNASPSASSTVHTTFVRSIWASDDLAATMGSSIITPHHGTFATTTTPTAASGGFAATAYHQHLLHAAGAASPTAAAAAAIHKERMRFQQQTAVTASPPPAAVPSAAAPAPPLAPFHQVPSSEPLRQHQASGGVAAVPSTNNNIHTQQHDTNNSSVRTTGDGFSTNTTIIAHDNNNIGVGSHRSAAGGETAATTRKKSVVSFNTIIVDNSTSGGGAVGGGGAGGSGATPAPIAATDSGGEVQHPGMTMSSSGGGAAPAVVVGSDTARPLDLAIDIHNASYNSFLSLHTVGGGGMGGSLRELANQPAAILINSTSTPPAAATMTSTCINKQHNTTTPPLHFNTKIGVHNNNSSLPPCSKSDAFADEDAASKESPVIANVGNFTPQEHDNRQQPRLFPTLPADAASLLPTVGWHPRNEADPCLLLPKPLPPVPNANAKKNDGKDKMRRKKDKRPFSAWHGLRVRIGIHYGMGDIRKDPVSQGYDYYGTVVNTAARVEGVGHGGQILLTDAAYEAVGGGAFLRSVKLIVIALGPQPLRGLDEPLKLFQLVPDKLHARQFPALRLHIEKETEDESNTDVSGTQGVSTGGASSESPEVLIARLCATKQYIGTTTPAEVLDRFNFMNAVFGPTTEKYRASVMVKLGEAWGVEGAKKQVGEADSGHAGATASALRLKFLVGLIGKMARAYAVSAAGRKAKRGGGGSNPLGSDVGGGGGTAGDSTMGSRQSATTMHYDQSETQTVGTDHTHSLPGAQRGGKL